MLAVEAAVLAVKAHTVNKQKTDLGAGITRKVLWFLLSEFS